MVSRRAELSPSRKFTGGSQRHVGVMWADLTKPSGWAMPPSRWRGPTEGGSAGPGVLASRAQYPPYPPQAPGAHCGSAPSSRSKVVLRHARGAAEAWCCDTTGLPLKLAGFSTEPSQAKEVLPRRWACQKHLEIKITFPYGWHRW